MSCSPHQLLLHAGWGCFLVPKWSRQDCHALVEMNKKAVTYAKSGKSLRKEKSSIFFFFLVVLLGIWDLNSPTRDRNCDPSGGSRVLMLDHQGSPKSSNLGGPLACLGDPPGRGCRCYFLTQKYQPSSCRCPRHPPVCLFPKPSCVLFWALDLRVGAQLGNLLQLLETGVARITPGVVISKLPDFWDDRLAYVWGPWISLVL